MQYDKQLLEDKISRFGEVFVVLDSGVEYQIHGTEQVEFMSGEVRVEGIRESSGEYLKVEFPLDAIEHVYTHKEV